MSHNIIKPLNNLPYKNLLIIIISFFSSLPRDEAVSFFCLKLH